LGPSLWNPHPSRAVFQASAFSISMASPLSWFEVPGAAAMVIPGRCSLSKALAQEPRQMTCTTKVHLVPLVKSQLLGQSAKSAGDGYVHPSTANNQICDQCVGA